MKYSWTFYLKLPRKKKSCLRKLRDKRVGDNRVLLYCP